VKEGRTNTEYVREHEHLEPVELWDPVEGRMIKLPKKLPGARAKAEAQVAAALGSRRARRRSST
jgi:hypothetical protein